ncbi:MULTISPECIES: capsular biosynthesis protein [unclassified Exiguobacterium]|uniref:capsular biosynthesis protein n=1 Tax=unclassified Exiguobacterium TaxID=2644629 RepID=UPI00103C35E9|nr:MULTISPECIES: capsular biosynthesis protein [unclassified Exiguobacterium]TCI71259.1 capsular biosynthesis protein [Exiguobacterium sp. IPCI3]TCI81237.1 capsular biosynthesis protein [Exiguobacterium sp. IPCH1]TCI82434.1 capsular biosynthesis protein [Exiguobacterium sp. IPBC4]
MSNKKKICFISLTNLYLTPYIHKYISETEYTYDVIYWNRHEIVESIGAENIYAFNSPMNEGINKLNKAIGYLKFIKYAKEKLLTGNYDGIILLQTSLGVMLNKILLSEFRKKYILDIRDYTLENNKYFFKLVKKLVENSSSTVISSAGYKAFLPEYDYIIVHNDNEVSKEETKKKYEKTDHRKKSKIVISYIGLIRFNEQNKKMIIKFKNDDRFLLKFIGTGANHLKSFCDFHNVRNVVLIDKFPPEKTIEYYYESDIIYNVYGNNTPLLDYALSNKLYYAAKLGMPILVSPYTYMEEISLKYGFGYSFDLENNNACTELYDYYNNINWIDFRKNTEAFVNIINTENENFKKMVKEFLD